MVSELYTLQVTRQLRRIGVDLERLGGIAGRAWSPEDFLRWLRTIPGGIGHEEFIRLAHGVPDRAPDALVAADVEAYEDPEMDTREDYGREKARVLTDWRPGFGYDLPHGRKHGLRVLRSLPDGAGIEAFIRALADTPPLDDEAQKDSYL